MKSIDTARIRNMHNTEDAQKKWRQAQKQVRGLTDKLGRGVDKEIIDTVAILHLYGFNTTGSCEGHARRVTGGPYVIIQSPKAQHYAMLAREVGDPRSERYRRLRKKANYFRALDLERLADYLQDFYAVHRFHYKNHLIVQSMPMALNILQCQNAETALTADASMKKAILKNNQKEMAAFTEYLKEAYFRNS